MFFIEERLRRIADELAGYIYTERETVRRVKMKQGGMTAAQALSADDSNWPVLSCGERWGGRNLHFWFRTEVQIPQIYEGKCIIFEVKTGRERQWDATNPQFLAYVNGKPVQGLDVNHTNFILCENAKIGASYSIALYAYSGMTEGLSELNCSTAVLNRAVEKLYYDIKVPLDVAALLPKEDKKKIDIINQLNQSINLLDLRRPFSEEFEYSVEAADRYLDENFYHGFCGHHDVTAVCIGHTHIDVAWLWPLAQTREKAVRSFATVLNLMKQYPEYIFMSSQPQLYKFVKEDQPELYEEIKQRVKEGRWEPEGAMWLEADCNLTSGESLVRQILFGTRFFEKEFGVKSRILWLPDVFGYSAALPQILKKSGIDYFMTTKISWNEYNKIPCDTFQWEGMDGTEVLTHFITTKDSGFQLNEHVTTYNGNLIPGQVLGSWERYQQKGLNDEVLISYGFGDGGGGPTKEMLENAGRMQKGIPGCPAVRLDSSLNFFKRLENKVSGSKKLPRWVGELYLEYHRGTYTSMARNKKYNRKSEYMYQDAELLSVIGAYAAKSGEYPQAELNEGWETILLNQFHDILPGSSIREVYEDSQKQYEEIAEKGRIVINHALNGICSRVSLSGRSIVVFNQLSRTRNDIVEFTIPEGLDSFEVLDNAGKPLPLQVMENGKALFFARNIPAKGYKAFRLTENSTARGSAMDSMDIGAQRLENDYFKITLDENFNIISLFDKRACREVLSPGARANVLQAFEDKPHDFDAWNIDIYYQEKMWEVNDVESVEITESGPVRSCLRVKRRFGDSEITQNIYIYSCIPRIDFSTMIDWKEKQVLLKAAFPVDIHADKAAYEIQYGNVERPTHWNTSWDMARFEVCAHKWADLSEDNYGVSLLNDCKYGHDIKDGTMRLTLLKSAADPNPDADREHHEFTYSLYPHEGGWKQAGTVPMAYSLNCPMYTKIEEAHEGPMPEAFSLASSDQENVIIEVVKKAEDSDEIIVRAYECYNRRTQAVITMFREFEGVCECDLMENNLSEVGVQSNSFSFEIRPYEIKTFKIKLK